MPQSPPRHIDQMIDDGDSYAPGVAVTLSGGDLVGSETQVTDGYGQFTSAPSIRAITR